LAHIKPYLGQTTVPPAVLLQQPWFLALQGIPLLAWLGALAWRKRQDNLASNPRRRRRLEVAKSVRRNLQHLALLAEQNKPEEFFATVFRILQEQLGDRLDLPASAITESVLDERLRASDSSEDLLRRLHELFQACNQARYAGHASSEHLNSLLPKIETAVRDLQKLEVMKLK
jgi:hypothetical protein